LFLNVANEDASNAQIHPIADANALSLAFDEPHESLPDCSAAEESDIHLAHAILPTTSACSRSSMRSRASSRPTERRIRPSPIPTLLRTSASIDACVTAAGSPKRPSTLPRLS